MLTRLGNKSKLAAQIYPFFTPHKMRITPFFGAGGLFFNTPKAKYNILNDFDNDISNLYLVVQNQREELYKAIELLPISSAILDYWKVHTESDPVKKAIRFLLRSNFTYLGKGNTLRIGLHNSKKILLQSIEPTFLAIKNEVITCYDFREVIPKISFSDKIITKSESFVYLDPIYYGTEHYYKVPRWTKQSTIDCLDLVKNCGINCAMSEFDHPFVLKEAKKRGFFITNLKERQNINNRKIEVLITNYAPPIPEPKKDLFTH